MKGIDNRVSITFQTSRGKTPRAIRHSVLSIAIIYYHEKFCWVPSWIIIHRKNMVFRINLVLFDYISYCLVLYACVCNNIRNWRLTVKYKYYWRTTLSNTKITNIFPTKLGDIYWLYDQLYIFVVCIAIEI